MGARRRGGRGARVSGVEGFGACEIWGFFRKGLAVVEDRAAPCVRGRAACWEGGGEKEEDGPHGAGAELGCCVGGGEEEEAVEKVTSGRRWRGWEVVMAVNMRWMRRGVI